MAQHCHGIRIISLINCASIKDAGVLALAKGCVGMTNIYMGGCTNITDTAAQALAQYCPGITIIGIINSTLTVDRIRYSLPVAVARSKRQAI